jgi:NAD(P)H-dependent FMN reductase
MGEESKMNVTVISGSHRRDSQSAKVGNYISAVFSEELSVQSSVFDLGVHAMPMWSEGKFKDAEEWQNWPPLSASLIESDALVVVTPEWGGMATPAIKNFFLLCDKSEIAHKPSLIVSVSNARGGAYPVSDIRQSSYKNSHVCHIPEHLIVRDVANLLNEDDPVNENDRYIRERIRYAAMVLIEYAKALKGVRESGVIDQKKFPNGM